VELGLALTLLLLSGLVIERSVDLNIGWGPNGPDAGFLPFWLALFMAAGTLVVIVKEVHQHSSQTAFLPGREEMWAIIRLMLSFVGFAVLLPYLGIYITSALYLGLFSWFVGKHRWYVALAVAILIPVALFFALDEGFRLLLPKSFLYKRDLIPF
jgi:hypothetical protein